MSLQSPCELVKPHATCVLLPTTTAGTPAASPPSNDVAWRWAHPAIRERRDTRVGDAHGEMHVVGDEARPSAVRRPEIAQLLLPMAPSLSTPNSHTLDAARPSTLLGATLSLSKGRGGQAIVEGQLPTPKCQFPTPKVRSSLPVRWDEEDEWEVAELEACERVVRSASSAGRPPRDRESVGHRARGPRLASPTRCQSAPGSLPSLREARHASSPASLHAPSGS